MNKYFSTKTSIFIFAFPGLLLFTAFVIFPLIPELIISLQNHDGFASSGYVGIKNYIDVFQSSMFWKSNRNTIIIVLMSTLITLPFSFILALLLDTQTSGVRRFFKASSVFPAVLSVTVIAQMWVAIYEPQWGLLNSVLRAVGLESWTREWLTDKNTVVFAIGTAFLWQYIGFNMLLFYTGLKSIPRTYYEAALIDGAGPVKCTIKITIPLLQDVIKYLLVISVLGSMAMFAHVEVMTLGGPGGIARTIVYQLYYTAFMTSEFGKGCAYAVIFVIECLIITLIINRFVARERIEY
ncbi:MAG TPA: sugar ABC transporter permease [Clostridiaceae bacterium]|nr:sugar ABC transporter permease [Clostridiaceae bacterium]